jgi:DNA-binding response OmpR family regulator
LALRGGGFDAAILDVMLPEMDGFELCRAIRKESALPIVMLTARGDVMDRVVGLELGADDYLPKPFEPRELLARIQTILRRVVPPAAARGGCAEGIQIDLDRRTCSAREASSSPAPSSSCSRCWLPCRTRCSAATRSWRSCAADRPRTFIPALSTSS